MLRRFPNHGQSGVRTKHTRKCLQTAQRESVSDRKRVEVEKFKSRLNEVNSESKADRRVQRSKLENEVKLEVEKLANNLKDVQREVSSTPKA